MPSDLQLAFALADRAAELSIRAFENRDFRVEHKPDASPVTTADKEIEIALRDAISRERPHDDVVGEEFGGQATDGRCWYLDPIDGTSSFVEGNERWGTLIALAQRSEVTTAVIDVPIQGRRFWASRGQGAFADGERLRVSKVGRLSEATVGDDFKRNIEHATPGHPLARLAARCRNVHPNREYSMLALARGRADVALDVGGGPWDHAPFVLLVEEAGGKATDMEGRHRFDGPLLATNGALHDQCLAALREAMDGAT